MKIYQRWLKYSFYLFITIVLIISSLNYKIDSLGIFGNTNNFSKAAKSLANGQMIAGFENYDERLFQELVIKNQQVKNDVIAIGSSRLMLLRKGFLNNDQTFFNHSVSGASLEDYISLVGVYEKIHGYIPSTIILGIDPWVFNKYNGQNRWKRLKSFYNYEIGRISNNKSLNDTTINMSKWKQLINYDYTISNIRFLISYINNTKKTFYVTDTINVDDSVKEIDGSIHYPYKVRYQKDEKTKKAAESFIKSDIYSLENFDKLSNIDKFEKFITYLQLKKVKLIVVLPPYHPTSYNYLIEKNKYKNILFVEEYLNDFFAKKDITIYGSYDPKKLGFSNNDFIDGMHGREIVMKRILNKLK